MGVPTTQMTGRVTAIPGLIVFDVTKVGDERGWFQEKFQKEKLVAAGLPATFSVAQSSLVFNKKGVTRGVHAEPWDKYVSVVNGKVFSAFVDLRKGETFGHVVTVEIDSEIAVYIPRGVGNSYQVLTDDLYYLYSVNALWTEEAYRSAVAVNLADPTLNAAWPIPLTEAIISERDQSRPLLQETVPMVFDEAV